MGEIESFLETEVLQERKRKENIRKIYTYHIFRVKKLNNEFNVNIDRDKAVEIKRVSV